MFYSIISGVLIMAIFMTFFILSKQDKWQISNFSCFECGFSSYFFSRYSFSIHFFLIGMIFLFLDLEICLLMPFLMAIFDSYLLVSLMIMFLIILLLGLFVEWLELNMDWKY